MIASIPALFHRNMQVGLTGYYLVMTPLLLLLFRTAHFIVTGIMRWHPFRVQLFKRSCVQKITFDFELLPQLG